MARIAASRAANSSPAAAAATEEEEGEAAAASAATCLSASFADSVVPAPLSPLMMIDCDLPDETMAS